MLGSPKDRDIKLEKALSLKPSQRLKHISDLKIDPNFISRQSTERKFSGVKSPNTPKRSEIKNLNSPHSPQPMSPRLPSDIDLILTQAKFDLEDIYYTSQGLWAFKHRVSEVFDQLRKSLSEQLEKKGFKSRTNTEKSATSPEVREIIKDLNKSKGLISGLHKDLEKKIPLLSDYKQRIRELTSSLDYEKSKNSELSFKLSKIELEKETLMNSGNSFISPWRNNSRDSKEILELSNLSPLSSPKASIFSRKPQNSYLNLQEKEENSYIINSLVKENEDLKKNLELILHNYDNLCGKMKIQREDFQRFKDQTEESMFFNEIQIKDSFFELYTKICPEEENRLRYNSQFLKTPSVFFTEILNKFEKIRENFEIQKFLLEKSQEENKNLLAKFEVDKDYYIKQENDQKSNFFKELDLTKCEILRQKNKKRALKGKLNEAINNFQIKFLESQSLAEELLITQSQGSLANEEMKDKKREILVIEQENKVKSGQIQELKQKLKEKEAELKELNTKFVNHTKNDTEKTQEILDQKNFIENLQSQLRALKKIVEDTESQENQLGYFLKIKEAELKSVESKLALQVNINERLKDSHTMTKAEIIKKFNEKLEEKEKLFQELQELNENLSRKLDSTHKTVQSMHEMSQAKDFEHSKSMNLEMTESKNLIQGLISKLSMKTGENLIDSVSGLKDSVRILDSLIIILVNQLDSANNQLKLTNGELNKLQEDLRKSQSTIQELTIKFSALQMAETNSERIKFLLKEKCNNRKKQINTLESQIKEKEILHQQTIQAQKEKLQNKKQKLSEKLKNKESELAEIKKILENSSFKTSENVSALIEKEKLLKSSLDEHSSKLAKVLEENACYKKQHDEDEALIYKQNKYILKLEQQKEMLQQSETSLKAERTSIILENNEKLKALQDNLAEINQIRRKETEEDNLSIEDDDNTEVKISKLFKQLQEKESSIKKANKRIMELQWAHRDVIEQCKENEEKVLAQVENNEKLTEENDKLNEQINNLNAKIKGLESAAEEFKEKIKACKENEAGLKAYENSLHATIEELKLKNEDCEDEINSLQNEINEFQGLLKNYAEENSSLSVANRSLNDTVKKLKEDLEDANRDKQVLAANLARVKGELASKESYFDVEQENFENLKDIWEQEKMNLEQQISVLQGKHSKEDEKIKNLSEGLTKIGEDKILLRKSTSISLEKADMIEKLQQELQDKAEEILEYQGLYSDIQKELNDLSNDFSIKELTLNKKNLSLNQDLIKAKAECKSAKKEKKSLKKTVDDLSKTLEKLKSDIYDKDSEIKKLIEEKQVMANYTKSKLQGQDLEDLINIKADYRVLEENYARVQEQVAFNKQQDEEIIESLQKQLDIFRNEQKYTSKNMWTHVDQLTKQLAEKSRLLEDKEAQLVSRQVKKN